MSIALCVSVIVLQVSAPEVDHVAFSGGGEHAAQRAGLPSRRSYRQRIGRDGCGARCRARSAPVRATGAGESGRVGVRRGAGAALAAAQAKVPAQLRAARGVASKGSGEQGHSRSVRTIRDRARRSRPTIANPSPLPSCSASIRAAGCDRGAMIPAARLRVCRRSPRGSRHVRPSVFA